MAGQDQERGSAGPVTTATSSNAPSPEHSMHETRMNVTRQRRAAMRKGEGKGGAPEVDIPEGGGKPLDGSVRQSMERSSAPRSKSSTSVR